MTGEYYYHLLASRDDGKVQQRAYYLMKQGLAGVEASFPVPRLSAEVLSEIFTFVQLDHPEIFYAVSFSYSFQQQADFVDFTPKYLFKKKEIAEHQKAIDARIRKLTLPAQNLPEYEKELYVHDFICSSVRYDKLKKPYSHEIIGPLTQGVGVCEGIAKTVKVLCDALGLPCLIAFCHNNPEKGIKYRHAWNIVKLGGKYYHLDATFDNTLSAEDGIRYDYFNTNDGSIFRDHETLVWPVPSCPERSEFYYIRKKLSFTKLEEVRSRVAQAANKGRTLVFHWRGGYLTREMLQELCTLLNEEAGKKDKSALLSLNWPQAVFHVTFEASTRRACTEETVTVENANEGEME